MAREDDLLDPSEIEALLAQANGGQAPAPASPPPATSPSAEEESVSSSSDIMGSDDIEAMLRQSGTAARGARDQADFRQSQRTEQLLNQAEANLAAALAPNLMGQSPKRQDLSGAAALQLHELALSLGAEDRAELSMLQDVELDLRIELGRTDLLIEEVVSLKAGSVVPLDKLAGDPVDILVNGRLIARGEVLVLNDNFCVRVAEILTPRE